MASQPPKRVRTGCLKCRVRRRKCDEGKPRCQRCVTGNFECVYGTRLSFLEKNAFTVAEPGTPAQETVSTPSYRKVQFVEDVSGSPSGEEQQPLQAQTQSTVDSDTAYPGQQTHAGTDVLSATGPQQADTSATNWSPRGIGSLSSSGGDQIALDALLSLGSEHATVFIDRNLLRTPISSVALEDPQGSVIYHDTVDGHEGPAQDIPFSSTLSPKSGLGIPEESEFNLLKHYRYAIAPWLDLCDLGQTFGMAVPCLASESVVILRGVLSLCTQALSAASTLHYSSVSDYSGFLVVSRADSHSAEEQLLIDSLSQAQQTFRNPDCLERKGPSAGLLHGAHELLLAAPTSVSMASYHLVVRLELGKALMHELPISVPLHIPETHPSPWYCTDLARQIFYSAHIPLFLCIRAVNFCWGEASDRVGLTGDMVTTWRNLLDELNSWYHQRPQEFISMVEIETANDGYPMILFTSGAAVFSNQLYHTAILLLLRHKPRTVVLPSKHRSSTMSTLWHARRICGIALNNENRECWDTSLVASLLVAARIMTHETQHQVLLAGIDKVERLTGWSLDTIRSTLKAEWGN
ncbi:hypothetical protein BKA67DRAFT_689565 [Truncatella angustata]|uniref:Zn(2)-C6 fungal-type domain-containing protein n=1 Tax=Truncatella angustata TaxID=152316 RepID=A0A9P8UUU8_9PEZI|nr:uncharacterized protein BKA67DRAFT_689565 [Truncatella angustata]KAH6658425.1 hypothetical protein BKA67DRAFT_689565 [Truncatella angustata]